MTAVEHETTAVEGMCEQARGSIQHICARRVDPEIFRLNGVYRLIYYYCDCSSDCGGVALTVEPLMVVVVVDC
eukprot:jgi/Chrzof1/5200/Cz15g16040.t1